MGYCIDGVYFPHNIGQGAANDEEQIVSALNCGIDVLMEGQRYDEARQAIIDGVNDGTLTEERLDDAVTRFIKLKKDSGIMADPFLENADTVKQETGSDKYRAVAEKLIEESLVLLKNAFFIGG